QRRPDALGRLVGELVAQKKINRDDARRIIEAANASRSPMQNRPNTHGEIAQELRDILNQARHELAKLQEAREELHIEHKEWEQQRNEHAEREEREHHRDEHAEREEREHRRDEHAERANAERREHAEMMRKRATAEKEQRRQLEKSKRENGKEKQGR
ncbi:hypothetical protein N9Z43_06600, partial [Akkermansiaceae bacterium]|nr:hypothetical protein [Akkermansiaceae bacterium]